LASETSIIQTTVTDEVKNEMGKNCYPELDPPPPRSNFTWANIFQDTADVVSGEGQQHDANNQADYTKWDGRNMFLCKARCVSGPSKEIVPSLIVHSILLFVILNHLLVSIPFNLQERPQFPNPTIVTTLVEFMLLILAFLTQGLALKS